MVKIFGVDLGFGKSQTYYVDEAEVIEKVLSRKAQEKAIEEEIAEAQRVEKARKLLLAQQERQARLRAKAASDQLERDKIDNERAQAERRNANAQQEFRVLSALALLMRMRGGGTKKTGEGDEIIDASFIDITPRLPEPRHQQVKKSESVLDRLPKKDDRRGKDGRKQF